MNRRNFLSLLALPLVCGTAQGVVVNDMAERFYWGMQRRLAVALIGATIDGNAPVDAFQSYCQQLDPHLMYACLRWARIQGQNDVNYALNYLSRIPAEASKDIARRIVFEVKYKEVEILVEKTPNPIQLIDDVIAFIRSKLV